ncbi:hypothetical protein DSL72_003090 [Monilinia vaccinii-corymbosi]|uniref:Cyanovirin-N domain-containing protein n=1 Tax=Monilinia vaccinii-corymbosi TaxID=61207 RepID=A0A8A3P1B2_9HELO|nr:hypothetical protein DSL72_003090 [Monilinia vaccinii-corymbosi]
MAKLSFSVLIVSLLASVANAQQPTQGAVQGFLDDGICNIPTVSFNNDPSSINYGKLTVECPPSSGAIRTIWLDKCISVAANGQLQWDSRNPGFLKRCSGCSLVKSSFIECLSCGKGFARIVLNTGIVFDKDTGNLQCPRVPKTRRS